MERVFKIKNTYVKNLPGVAHLDNSSRVQTVSPNISPDFYKILQEFEKISFLSHLLNNSFKKFGEQ